MEERELDSPPALTGLYAKALTGAILPGGDELPSQVLVLPELDLDRERLTEYDRVCGFRLGDTVPATYPHLFTFPLAMVLMTERSFPFSVLGMVHIANRIEQHRPLARRRAAAAAGLGRGPAPAPARAPVRRHLPGRGGGGDRLGRADHLPAARQERRGVGGKARGRRSAARDGGGLGGRPRRRPPLRGGLRRPQPDPHVGPRGEAVRDARRRRPRDVDEGPLPGRLRGPPAGAVRGRRRASRRRCGCRRRRASRRRRRASAAASRSGARRPRSRT